MSKYKNIGNIRVLSHQRDHLEAIRKRTGTVFAEYVRQLIQRDIDRDGESYQDIYQPNI